MFKVCVCSVNNDYIPIVNGSIVSSTPSMIEHFEQCNSFPGCSLPTTRPEVIFVRSTMSIGESEELCFSGKDASIVAHALEHLEGKSAAVFLGETDQYKLTAYMAILAKKIQSGTCESSYNGNS